MESSLLVLIRCTLPYGLEIIIAMSLCFRKYYETPAWNQWLQYYNPTEISTWTIQLYTSLQLKLLFNCYVRRTVHRQDFGPKFNLTCPISTPFTDIYNCLLHLYFCKKDFSNGFPCIIYCNYTSRYYIISFYFYTFAKKGFLKCSSLYTAIILSRKSIVEVYYICILLYTSQHILMNILQLYFF